MAGCTCVNRRTLVKAGIGGLVLTGIAGLYGAVKSLVPMVSYEPLKVLVTKKAVELAANGISDFQVADRKVSVIMGANGLYALVRNCTHMGCIPNLSAVEQRFLCPCHGSVFTMAGDVVRGPAPEPLFRAALSINSKGLVVIDAGTLENHPDRREKEPFLLSVTG